MDMNNIDLNAPAFGEGSQKIDDVAPIIEAPTEEAEAQTVEVEQEQDRSEDESKVPYSRFKKFHDEAKFYKEQAEEWQRRAESLKPQEPVVTTAPDWWVKLYGDSPEAVEAWQIQAEQNERLKQEAREEAIQALRDQEQQEEQRVNDNLSYIDDNISSLSDKLGRELTSKEESALLDIVDEYTPKDDNGDYIGALMPFDKAWEIYELKNKVTKAPTTQARDSVAALSGTQSQGSVEVDEKNKNFNPLDWNAWKQRI